MGFPGHADAQGGEEMPGDFIVQVEELNENFLWRRHRARVGVAYAHTQRQCSVYPSHHPVVHYEVAGYSRSACDPPHSFGHIWQTQVAIQSVSLAQRVVQHEVGETRLLLKIESCNAGVEGDGNESAIVDLRPAQGN